MRVAAGVVPAHGAARRKSRSSRGDVMAQPSPAAVPPPEVAEHEPVIKESRAKRLYFIIGIAVLVLLIGYGIYALVTSGKEGTDDAEVAADVVPVSARIA